MGARGASVVPSVVVPPPGKLSTAYGVRQWTTADGLPGCNIQCLRQTRDGYLWAGTAQGLARFDGVQFKVFKGINAYCMTEDSDGALWLGTADGLYRFDGLALKRVQINPTSPDLWGRAILALCPRSLGGIWVCDGDRLASVDLESFDRVTQIVTPSVKSLLEDSSGKVWLGRTGSPQAFRRWDPKSKAVEDFGLLPGLQAPKIGALLEESPGMFLLAGPTFVDHLAAEGDHVSISSRIECQNDSPFVSLAKDTSGVVWLGRIDGLWQAQGEALVPVETNEKLSIAWVVSLAAGREGGVWVGTQKDGLFLVTPEKIQTLTHAQGLVGDDAWSITASRDGSLWIATEGGVSHWSGDRCENFSTGSGLPSQFPKCVVEDNNGRIWVGTENHDGAPGGVSFLEHGRFNTLGAKEGFTSPDVSSLAPGPDGSVWISCVQGVTLWRDGQLLPFKRLPGQGILFVDQNKQLWSGGEELWCLQGGQWTDFPKTRANRLEPGLHAVVKQDETGAYWLVSERQGVVRFKNGEFKAITTQNGLFSDLTLSLLEDDYGRYWFNSHTGIFWAYKNDLNEVAEGRKQRLTCVHYGTDDGMKNVEGNGGNWPNSCKTRDGRLWFPTVKGVAIVDPRLVAGDELPPAVFVEEMRADGEVLFSNSPNFAQANTVSNQTLPFSTGGRSVLPTTLKRAEVRLSPGRGHALHFDYTSTSMFSPEKLFFRHRLVGQEWIEAGHQRFADMEGLSPGHYRFQVAACNAHGVWSDPGTELDFWIEPAFYQRWTFYGPCAIALAAVVGGFGGYRRRMRLRIASLEKEATLRGERERITHDLHDDLGGSLTHIARRLDAMRSSHQGSADTDQELGGISSSARSAIESINQIIWATNPTFDDLASLSAYIREFASKYFAENAGIAFKIDLPDETGVQLRSEFRRNIFYTVKEALNNVTKHAKPSMTFIFPHPVASRKIVTKPGHSPQGVLLRNVKR